eukprot:scaffold4851_cov428-Prasinococcus_capsulatus_cf.AAC.24
MYCHSAWTAQTRVDLKARAAALRLSMLLTRRTTVPADTSDNSRKLCVALLYWPSSNASRSGTC